eukprot:scaffold21752_cov67-Isochrysis_galbana.AAC.1
MCVCEARADARGGGAVTRWSGGGGGAGGFGVACALEEQTPRHSKITGGSGCETPSHFSAGLSAQALRCLGAANPPLHARLRRMSERQRPSLFRSPFLPPPKGLNALLPRANAERPATRNPPCTALARATNPNALP